MRHSSGPAYITSASALNSLRTRPFYVLTKPWSRPHGRGRFCQSTTPEIENCKFRTGAFRRRTSTIWGTSWRTRLEPGYLHPCNSCNNVAHSNLSSCTRSVDGGPPSQQLWDNGASPKRFLQFLYSPCRPCVLQYCHVGGERLTVSTGNLPVLQIRAPIYMPIDKKNWGTPSTRVRTSTRVRVLLEYVHVHVYYSSTSTPSIL